MYTLENPVVKVNLGTIDKVRDFVRTLSDFDANFDLISGHYMVDAKSILGVFSLNYSQDVELRIMDAKDNLTEVMTAIRPYLAAQK
jgi:phosphotransferase system HPr-like phosphotransfer protein